MPPTLFGSAKVLLCLFAILGVAKSFASMNDISDRPNIIFFLTDDQRAEAVGFETQGKIHTPSMDEIASKGVVFKQAYATTAICEASRASILTGKYEYKTGVNFDAMDLAAKDWQQSYPAILHAHGYYTGFGGKFGFAVRANYRKDFDEWGGFIGASQGSYKTADSPTLARYAKQYPQVSRALGAFGVDFLKKAATIGKPFSLSISFKAPHLPYDDIAVEDRGLYKDVVFDLPKNDGDRNSNFLSVQAKVSREYLERDSWLRGYQKSALPYYQLIAGADAAIRMILDELQRQGMADNTVIIFSSDNGYNMGSHGLGDKVTLYNSATKVPLVVFDPRNPQRVPLVTQSVGNIDIAPTILGLAGIPTPASMDGASLEPLLKDKDAGFRESTLLIKNWAWTGGDISRALGVVTKRWKYIYYPWFNDKVQPAEELFDMQQDPGETHNLAGEADMQEILQSLRDLYDSHLAAWNKNHVQPDTVHLYDRAAELYKRGTQPRNFRGLDYIGDPREIRQMQNLYDKFVGR